MDSNALLLQRSSPPWGSVFLGSFKPNLNNKLIQSSVSLKLGSINCVKSSQTQIYNFSPGEELKQEIKEIVNPVYVPTPSNRPLRPPHSGYHFDGSRRKFFEGWYFKVSIPEIRQSFCFMYSVENPAFKNPLNTLEKLQYGSLSTGVGAQILGADDKYICQYTNQSHNFWGSKFSQLIIILSFKTIIVCYLSSN